MKANGWHQRHHTEKDNVPRETERGAQRDGDEQARSKLENVLQSDLFLGSWTGRPSARPPSQQGWQGGQRLCHYLKVLSWQDPRGPLSSARGTAPATTEKPGWLQFPPSVCPQGDQGEGGSSWLEGLGLLFMMAIRLGSLSFEGQ